MKALITGGSGFVGRALTRALLARGDDVDITGVDDQFDPGPLFPDAARRVRWFAVDARSDEQWDAALEATRPDLVFHLAAVSYPPDADRAPIATFDINALGVVRLLTAITRRRNAGILDPTIVVVGSGTQYGAHAAAEMPLDESAAQRPATIYAASKAAQELAALQHARATGARVVCTRSFNHSGAGQSEQYLLPALVGRVRGLARTNGRTLPLGNDAVRDFLHVDDVVAAYLLLAMHGVAGEVYNVSSGVGVSARTLAERVLLRAGVAADITTEPSLVRPTDIPVLVGSPAKLQRDTGWAPTKTHDDIIDDLLHASTD